ncbi:hypothetical protein MTR_7g078710 [Medicago truncatula]|uniref:Uncharacterized protein n=1 Tax=Medicago truncatula TaxID=3880 RepID=G7L6L2_MEDTR|nr:hypothetical protein MTR_7g078710 [Medicago truncatula]
MVNQKLHIIASKNYSRKVLTQGDGVGVFYLLRYNTSTIIHPFWEKLSLFMFP